MGMKILLIYPYFLEKRLHLEDISVVPQGVFYIAALLKKYWYDVEILNWYNINTTPHKISEVLAEKKPDVIGFSILHANRWGGIEIARIAKQIDPSVTIVFGGSAPRWTGRRSLNWPIAPCSVLVCWKSGWSA